MKRLRVCILAVVFMCLAAGDIFAVRMVESQNPTMAARGLADALWRSTPRANKAAGTTTAKAP